jgi:signal transduction histidine kinase
MLAGTWFVLAASHAWGACVPLPSEELRTLDDSVGRHPVELAGEIERRLAVTPSTDLLRRVQLQALLAKAYSIGNRVPAARESVKQARALLPQVGDAAAARTLGLILDAIDLNMANGVDQLRAGADSLTARLPAMPPISLERSCLLSTRASALAELGELDRAAADGIDAYALAKDGGWQEARALAAYGLAMVYRRSGLYADAVSMIDEAIAWARTQRHPSWLSYAEYLRAVTLIDAGRFDDARRSVSAARELAQSVGDKGVAASAGVLQCKIEVYTQHYQEAVPACAAGDPDLLASGRSRYLLTLEGLRANIDIHNGHPTLALARLDRVLAPGQRELVGLRLPQVYADRAAALSALGRYAAAYEDMRRSQQLAAEQDVQRHALAVAVLNARSRAELLRADNRALQERVARQGADLAQRDASVRLWRVASVAGALAIMFLGYLLLSFRHRERALRREEATLRLMSQHDPDALCLLDSKRRVRFANRALFGQGPAPTHSMTLQDALPMAVWADVASAIDGVYTDRSVVSLPIDMVGQDQGHRSFALRAAPVIEGGAVVGCVLRVVDVTDMRHLERKLTELASRERRQLGSDLHEGLAQELAGIAMLIASLKETIDRRLPELRSVTHDVLAYLQNAVGTTQGIARRFTPLQSVRGSFLDAVRQLAGEMARLPGVRIDLSCAGEGTVPDVVSDQLYAVIREFVGHDAPTPHFRHLSLQVSLEKESASLSLSGSLAQGASPDTALIAHRVRLVGGHFDVAPTVDGQSTVSIVVPLPGATVLPRARRSGTSTMYR